MIKIFYLLKKRNWHSEPTIIDIKRYEVSRQITIRQRLQTMAKRDENITPNPKFRFYLKQTTKMAFFINESQSFSQTLLKQTVWSTWDRAAS